jgi:hypothetical protein
MGRTYAVIPHPRSQHEQHEKKGPTALPSALTDWYVMLVSPWNVWMARLPTRVTPIREPCRIANSPLPSDSICLYGDDQTERIQVLLVCRL